uniref:Uncharacterized protein n=1 Tax=Mola mola TaxID=94237 RepID=A0A3Q3X6W6_MOLML
INPAWELSPFTVSPAASLLSRCVSRGALSQVTPAVSEQRRSFSSPVTASVLYLSSGGDRFPQRFQTFQTFCSHLQNLLKEQNSLRQRLATPLGRTNLPVHNTSLAQLLAHVGEVESLANQLCMTTFDPSPSFLGCVFCVVFVILCNSGFYFGNKNKL